jgi:uncharacterized protein YidB (DUF937 family)
MGLFFDVLSSINNPNQQGSVAQLETLTNTVQQAASEQGIGASQLQGILSALGGALSPVLRQQGLANGGLGGAIGQLAGAGASTAAIQALIPPQLQQQLIQIVSQKTGVSASTLQVLLPTLLPAVISLLNMGASKSGIGGTNPLLTAFLDGNQDGNTDLGDVLKFATRFLNSPR